MTKLVGNLIVLVSVYPEQSCTDKSINVWVGEWSLLRIGNTEPFAYSLEAADKTGQINDQDKAYSVALADGIDRARDIQNDPELEPVHWDWIAAASKKRGLDSTFPFTEEAEKGDGGN